MERNVASQEVRLFAFDYSTGAPKTGLTNLTAYVAKGTGAPTIIAANSGVMTEIDATNGPGTYKIALAQGETDATDLMFTARSATSNVACVARFVTTTPANYSVASFDSSGRTNVGKINDVATTPVTTIGANIGTTQPVNFNGTGASADVKVDVDTIKTNPVVNAGTITFPTGATLASTTNITAAALGSTERNAVADAILDRDMATGTDSSTTSGATGRTVRSALRVLRNKLSLVTGKSYKEDDSTTNFDLTVTTDGAALPITVADPA